MKKQLIIGGIVASAFLSSIAHAEHFFLKPYGGVDVGMQHFGFKKGYGDNLFKKQLPKVNIFAGIKFNEYFGVEAGYESTIVGKRESTLVAGDSNLGVTFRGQTIVYSSRTKISGGHLGLTGEYKLDKLGLSNLSAIGYVGLKHTNVKLARNRLKVNGSPNTSFEIVGNDSKKMLIKVSGGLQYFINNHIAVRALVGWENTSKIKPHSYTASGLFSNVQLKNSLHYSLGIILK